MKTLILLHKRCLKCSLGLLFILLLGSCTKDRAEEVVVLNPSVCDSVQVSYSADIQPVIQLNCSVSGCHDGGTVAGGYNFSTHSEVSSNISTILCAIRHRPGCSPMPKFAAKLADSTIQDFDCWDIQGRLNN